MNVMPCEECRKDYARGNSQERPYEEARWRRISRAFLAANKWCVLCSELGLSVKATVSDHYPRSRKELLVAGVPDPDDPAFLRPLCTGHHNARAASHTIRFDNDPA